MSPCCWCEGCYLGPKKRLEENPRLGMHISCFEQIVKTDSEIKAVLKFLQNNSGDIEILKQTLQNIEDFWVRMQKVKAFCLELRHEREEKGLVN